MADDSGVTNLEAGMLAENLREQTESGDGQSAISAQESPKEAIATVKKTPVPTPDTKLKKPSTPASVAPQPQAEQGSAAAVPGKGVTLKAIVTYVQYALIGLLLIGQLITLSNLSTTRDKISQLEKTLSDMNLESKKREVEQEKKFNEALQDKEKQDAESRKKSIVSETLNRLRNGLPEQRLIRRKGGDWYVMGSKGSKEVAIGNPEVIEALNYAHSHARATEHTSQIVPPHTDNAICVLKPDGKGGTEVTTAYDYIVIGK